MVEFLIMLPILLIMISGLIEFGFLLNYYLDLIDGARDGARLGANADPLMIDDYNPTCSTSYFYRMVGCLVVENLEPQVTVDLDRDDIVISAFSVAGGVVTARFPDADGWPYSVDQCALPECLVPSARPSGFSSADVQAMLDPAAPNTGVVLVEVFWNYDMILALPWITAFVEDPVLLHAYTMMPNTFVEPTRTPGP
jgi:hypothetical protein